MEYITSDRCHLDSRGGTLSLPEIGVTLQVPEDSLPTQIPTADISMTLHQGHDHQDGSPPIDNDHLMMTPIIKCGPAGMEFARPVTLSLPHSEDDYENIKKEDIFLWYKSNQGW